MELKYIHLLVIEHVYDTILPADLQRHRPPRRIGEVSIDIVGNSDSLGLPIQLSGTRFLGSNFFPTMSIGHPEAGNCESFGDDLLVSWVQANHCVCNVFFLVVCVNCNLGALIDRKPFTAQTIQLCHLFSGNLLKVEI